MLVTPLIPKIIYLLNWLYILGGSIINNINVHQLCIIKQSKPIQPIPFLMINIQKLHLQLEFDDHQELPKLIIFIMKI